MSAPHYQSLDLIKAIACNLIVLHHLAFYGPMADVAWPLSPEIFEFLERHARIAVHAFLTIGGFLAAMSLSRPEALSDPARVLARRFLKLVPPFMAAMLLAVAASFLASAWMTHDSISPPPAIGQLLAHGLLLHGVLGYESLSAGAWYVAIDFQLFFLLALLLLLAGGAQGKAALLLVTAGTAASLLYFNLEPSWDAWAPYFFGSYGLGVLAWRAGDPRCSNRRALLLWAGIFLLGGAALGLEFRSRIAVALGTALLLVPASRGLVALPGQGSRLAAFLGRISYSVFLVHFPVSLVVNAAFTRFAPAEAEVQMAGVLAAWLCSLATGAAFHQWVETPLAALFSADARRQSGSGGAAAAGRPSD